MQGASAPEHMQYLRAGIVQSGAIQRMQQDLVSFQQLGQVIQQEQQVLPEAVQTSPVSFQQGQVIQQEQQVLPEAVQTSPGSSQIQQQPDPEAVQKSPEGGVRLSQPEASEGPPVLIERVRIPLGTEAGSPAIMPRHCPAKVK